MDYGEYTFIQYGSHAYIPFTKTHLSNQLLAIGTLTFWEAYNARNQNTKYYRNFNWDRAI